MRLIPKIWTQHHTHRLYHISMLSVFAFAFGVSLWGVLGVLQVGLADFASPHYELSVQSSQGVSATVPEIAPGTSTPETIPAGASVPWFQANLSLFPEDYSQSYVLGKSGPVYIISSANPSFLGITNVLRGNVVIRLEGAGLFPLQAAVVADDSGHFRWQVPSALPEGLYNLSAKVISPLDPKITAEAGIVFYVVASPQSVVPPSVLNPRPGQTVQAPVNLPLMFLRVKDQSRQVRPGQTVQAQIIFDGFGSRTRPEQVAVEYYITNALGETSSAGTENVSVPGRLALGKQFFPASDARFGVYTLTARVGRNGYTLIAADSFVVRADDKPAASYPTVIIYNMFILDLLALVPLLLLFLLLIYYEYRRLRHHNEQIKKQEGEREDVRR